jgi:beta-lactamase regulating signal transducer with metallopeptidase domain
MIGAVMEAALRSCALGLALWLILAITRSRNPHVHKLVWSAALGAALAMPLLMRAPVVPTLHAPDYVLTLHAVNGGSTYSNAAWRGIDALYVLIALTLLCRFCVSLLRMWRIRRDSRSIAPWSIAVLGTSTLDVRVSTRLRSPSTFGVTILLPPDFVEWSHQKIAAVLAHERSHVAHRDCYVLWLTRLHAGIFWFNPFAWWLQRRLAALAETISDEAAVQAVGDTSAYAEILLEFATLRPVSTVATAMARPAIERRIERIISGIAPSAAPRLSRRILVIATILPVVAAAAAPLGQASLRLAQSATSIPNPASQQPSVKSWPALGELKKYYPREAERKGIDGLVQIQVTLDAQGRATDTLILSEDPQDMGFGAAASTLAHFMEYDNPTGRPAQLNFKVKFALGAAPVAAGTTNFENPDAQ